MTEPRHQRRRLNGIVVSTKMSKTIVVRVDRTVTHPKYGKRYRVSSRFKADDQNGVSKMGQRVTIEECRPLSKQKRWRVVEAKA